MGFGVGGESVVDAPCQVQVLIEVLLSFAKLLVAESRVELTKWGGGLALFHTGMSIAPSLPRQRPAGLCRTATEPSVTTATLRQQSSIIGKRDDAEASDWPGAMTQAQHRRTRTMHYRSGNPAKIGDKVIGKD